MNEQGKSKVDKVLFLVPLTIVVLLCASVAIAPEATSAAFNAIFGAVTGQFGWSLQLFFLVNTALMLYFIFGKYSNKRLGNDKPEFSNLTWYGMLFAAGTSGVAVYWGFSEWFQYATWPPFGLEPLSTGAMEYASTYSFFHWGPSCYGLYGTVAVVFGYQFFVKKQETNRPSVAMGSLIGKKNRDGALGRVIDIIYMVGIIGAVSAAIGLSTPLISAIVAELFHIEASTKIDFIIVLIMAAIFIVGAYGGLHKTIDKISNAKIYIVIFALALVFLCGNKAFMLNNLTNSLGLLIRDYFKMMMNTDPIDQIGFPQGWTIFFFAWWSAYGLSTGIFLARISRGRTVREVVIGSTASSCIGCWLHFIVFGYYGMDVYLKGKVDVVGIYSEQGIPAAIIAIMKTLPASTFFLILFFIVMIISTVTVINGVSYTLAITTTDKLSAKNEPARWNRTFWAFALGGLGLALIVIGGLTPIQTICISTGLLTMIAIALLWISFLKKDGKNWDRYIDKDYEEIEILEEERIKEEQEAKAAKKAAKQAAKAEKAAS